MTNLQRYIFEHYPFSPSVAALLAGFAVIGIDGQVRITAAGLAYLEEIER